MVIPAQRMAEVSRGWSRESVENGNIGLRGDIPEKKKITVATYGSMSYRRIHLRGQGEL